MTSRNLPYEFILIRYGELTLKGKNRKKFENILHEHVLAQLKDLNVKVSKTHGRMYVYLNGESVDVVTERLSRIFGISSFSPAIKSGLRLDEIKDNALKAVKAVDPPPSTFKVNVKRKNKSFPYASLEMNHHLGAHILRNTKNLRVDVHAPDVEVFVEIGERAAYVMCEKIPGLGGLPVGSSGKVMLMLSGGIDSPVAGYLALKRGLRFEAVHFHSFPFTSERAKQKVIDLTKQLAVYAGHLKLHIVPFTRIQTEIQKVIPEEYSITIMRRLMLRITEGLALKNQALGVVTGESLGQVASQTLHSMHTINAVTNFPVLRPLISMDKIEIINLSKKIGTYDTSILPYEDCCTVFQPKSPKTMPTKEATARLEERLAVDELVDDAIRRTETDIYASRYASHQEEDQTNELDALF